MRTFIIHATTAAALLVSVCVPTDGLTAEPSEIRNPACRRLVRADNRVPTFRRIWARWMPNLRLRASWTTHSDVSGADTHSKPISPFSASLHESQSHYLDTQLAAIWDVAELFEPLERRSYRRLKVRCRYLERRLKRRAAGGTTRLHRSLPSNSDNASLTH